jgi:hypothetical protein
MSVRVWHQKSFANTATFDRPSVTKRQSFMTPAPERRVVGNEGGAEEENS